MGELDGLRALITGGASGIGAAIAAAFARRVRPWWCSTWPRATC